MTEPQQDPIWRREPVALFGALQIVFAALIAVLTAFDVWTPTAEQITAISGLWAAVTALATFLIRGSVTPNGNVALTNEEANFIREVQEGN